MAILDATTVEFLSLSAEQTVRLGMRLGSLIEIGDILCFTGNLGSGKTTFIRGIAQGWGTIDAVSSPTFVIINEYNRSDGKKLYHMDAYRIGSPHEAEELDIERMFQSGAMLIEWAERILPVFPPERLMIEMEYVTDEQRRITMKPIGKRYEKLAQLFRQKSFGV